MKQERIQNIRLEMPWLLLVLLFMESLHFTANITLTALLLHSVAVMVINVSKGLRTPPSLPAWPFDNGIYHTYLYSPAIAIIIPPAMGNRQ